jgi:hypothetical protein
MDDKEDKKRLHSAGATVRHSSPFARLDVPARHDDPPRDFIEKWVQPFYMLNLWKDLDAFVAAVRQVAPELNEAVTAELLSYFNWRPRLVGAYFVAVRRFASFEEQVGRLLLRSDVCDAGLGYCAALACLNSPASVAFLEEYLDYYLTRADLWFDQGVAMAALGYLDQQNRATRRARFEPQWLRFIENKPHWDLAREEATFRATMEALEAAANATA